MPGAGPHCRHRVGDRAPGVVVAVDADRHVAADVSVHLAHDVVDLVRQRATVRVAQHHVRRALCHRRFERTERELGVLLEAVEEVLHVDEHHAAVPLQELDRVGDHRRALVERGLERLGDVVVGALGDDAHRAGVRVEQVLQRQVVVDLAARASRRAEGHEGGRGQVQLLLGAGEELDVLRVGARPAALDELDAERVELLSDAQLVLDGRRHALDLEAVAQGGVEDLDTLVSGGGVHRWSSLFRATKKPPVGRLDEHVGSTCSTK